MQHLSELPPFQKCATQRLFHLEMKTHKVPQADNPLDHKTIAVVVANMISYASSRGVPVTEIIEELGIDPAQLLDPNAKIKEDEFPKIMNMMAASLPGEPFTLDLAKVTPFSILGYMSSAVEFAPSVRDALEMLVQYRSVLSDRLHLTLEETTSHARLGFYHPMDECDNGAMAEFACAMLYRTICDWFELTGAISEIHFAHKPLLELGLYEEFFGTKVTFEQPKNALVIERGSLNKPSRLSSKPLYDYARAHLDRVHKENGLSNLGIQDLQKVHDAICENAAIGEYGAAALAEKLHLSLRTLQRLVGQHGKELREMLEEVRAANAKRLLASPDLGIDAIAHLLGYSDDRAFRRSFKRWANQSPSHYRDTLKANNS
ncbi:AraC family transcriptional regulator ligand-binding domain-containing protein [Rhodobacteraceae bacterium B1Z28]|uniref:AraC family transcriptional regulator ligand-binding domain-containing protein n=1 Tax=Ruegeria haliotis TaxID=2747601 RepID=A0ABX2PY60_9RHOB|nr:AraC family transcriptional regulator [Ruegeria haliotis]NVO58580.1 AraC family transcriptional regulator ligand-binding domain-containing protein [Ruegeria haliotis]